jgi:hypothetical protein
MKDRAEFISDENKVNLQAGDLFDRIINLKFHCQDKATGNTEVFVLRSDYELVYLNQDFTSDYKVNNGSRRFIVRKCTYKPSIKVQCKMVTSNVGTSIGITVSNFFMLTQDGKHIRSFNESKYVITAIEIVMGYWGQLKDSLNPDEINSEKLLQDYFDIKAVKGADKISITNGKPIIVTTDKLPPDSAIHIKGFVADIYSSPVAITKVATPVDALKKPVASSGTDLETLLFEQITRRYASGHRVYNSVNRTNKKLKTQLPVGAKGSFTVDGVEITTDDNGQMSSEDAKNYGVKVYLSDEAKKVHIEQLTDSKGNKKDRKLYFEAGWTIGQTITRIISYMDKSLDYTFSLEGDVIIYTPLEMQDVEKLTKACEAQEMYKETVLNNKELYNGRLPAVYNINIDAVATITCPFFTFIEPFQYVEFASRYALTSLVSYYASYNPTIYRFLVISASISFATVDDINEVQITAVSAKDSGEEA